MTALAVIVAVALVGIVLVPAAATSPSQGPWYAVTLVRSDAVNETIGITISPDSNLLPGYSDLPIPAFGETTVYLPNGSYEWFAEGANGDFVVNGSAVRVSVSFGLPALPPGSQVSVSSNFVVYAWAVLILILVAWACCACWAGYHFTRTR